MRQVLDTNVVVLALVWAARPALFEELGDLLNGYNAMLTARQQVMPCGKRRRLYAGNDFSQLTPWRS